MFVLGLQLLLLDFLEASKQAMSQFGVGAGVEAGRIRIDRVAEVLERPSDPLDRVLDGVGRVGIGGRWCVLARVERTNGRNHHERAATTRVHASRAQVLDSLGEKNALRIMDVLHDMILHRGLPCLATEYSATPQALKKEKRERETPAQAQAQAR